MKDWEMTGEEIRKAWVDDGGCTKAAQKKLLKCLILTCCHKHNKDNVWIAKKDCPQCWSELRDEFNI